MTVAWRDGPGRRDVRPPPEGDLSALFVGTAGRAGRWWQNLSAETEVIQSTGLKEEEEDKLLF